MTDTLLGFILGASLSAILVGTVFYILLMKASDSFRTYVKGVEKYKESSEKLIVELKQRLGLLL
jgi:hypothetical protein